MAKRVSIRMNRLPEALRKTPGRTYAAVAKGSRRGAFWGLRHLVPRTPTDRAELRRSWRVLRRALPQKGDAEVAVLLNDAPYAGIIEGGARPHPVSAEGRERIRAWAKRTLGLPEAELDSFVWHFAEKLRREGQRPTFFVRDELEKVRDLVGEAIEAALAQLAGKSR
jgi:hypothetical protein